MNKYRDKSDFEINKLIARLNDGIHIDDEITAIDCYIQAQSPPSSVLSCNGHISYLIYDFCNNPADAMPIIKDNLISLEHDGIAWMVSCVRHPEISVWDGCENYTDNFYRKAMELFLLMKDAENES